MATSFHLKFPSHLTLGYKHKTRCFVRYLLVLSCFVVKLWTHLHPYFDETLTAASLDRTARVALWRAINLRRLVVVTGSGTTSPYGFPSWANLAELFLCATEKELSEVVKNARGGLFPFKNQNEVRLLVGQLNELCNHEPTEPDDLGTTISDEIADKLKDLTLIMDLCEELLSKLPDNNDGTTRSERARRTFARIFKRDGFSLPQARFNLLFPEDVQSVGTSVDPSKTDSSPKSHFLHDDRYLSILYKVLNGSALEDARGDLGEASDPGTSDVRTFPDPVSEILSCLETRRVATLNFDIELERRILRSLQAEADPTAMDFRKLCAPEDTDYNLPSEVHIESGTRKGAISATINRDNVGELINFASFSRIYDYHVYHLHGRADDPSNMVLTQRDYQQTYVQDPASQQALEAAQEILFGGNDVLLLGVGMQEEDVLRPFRRFVSRSLTDGRKSRRTFVLMPSRYGKDWSIKNQQIALRHALHYNIYTLFFGGDHFRETREFLSELKSIVKAKKEEKHIWNSWLKVIATNQKLSELRHGGHQEAGYLSLLTEGEFENLTELIPKLFDLNGGRNCNKLKAAEAILSELEGRVQARALINQLRELRIQAGEWWNTWRHPPHERRAIYHCASSKVAGDNNYLWARHCPDYSLDIPDCPRNEGSKPSWIPLDAAAAEQLQHSKTKDDFDDKEGKKENGVRILRLTMPRGGGKGTLVSLLLNNEQQKKLFPTSDHTAAFVAHLSFSLEFNSVIKAFTRFMARRTAELQFSAMKKYLKTTKSQRWELKNGVPCLKNTRDEKKFLGWGSVEKDANESSEDWQHDNVARGVWGIVRELTGKTTHHKTPGLLEKRVRDIGKRGKDKFAQLLGKLDTPNGVLKTADKDFAKLVEAVFVSRREDEPALINQPHISFREDLKGDPPREHRLDILRAVMQAYEELAQGDERCFVCFSGLEKICDQNGDGYNPAHRAFFRLIARTEERQTVTMPNPPIDLVLIAGRPEAPITYLSEEKVYSDVIPLGDRQLYSYLSGTGRVLKKWKNLPRFTWEERSRLIGLKCRGDATARIGCFVKWGSEYNSISTARPISEFHSTSTIHRLLWEDLALSVWVMRLWAGCESDGDTDTDVLLNGNEFDDTEERKAKKLEKKRDAFLSSLDRAGARSGAAGVIDAILDAYRVYDKNPESKYSQVVENDASQAEAQTTTTNGSDAKNKKNIETPRTDPKLHDIILRHLVLFALPVEVSVLLACPLVDERLVELYRQEYDELKKQEPEQDHRSDDAWLQVWNEWQMRSWKLERLEWALNCLRDRKLIIRIFASADHAEGEDSFLHYRFAIHSKLRAHIAHKMRFSILDGGDQNHHQVSIYCDQPRDLPTPSSEHLKMVSDILDNQIRECLKTLNAAYRNSRYGATAKRKAWDPTKATTNEADKNDGRTAAEHVFGPDCSKANLNKLPVYASYDNNGEKQEAIEKRLCASSYGGSFFHIHAVPQRLRGCLSLLQGSFSIGALSRLIGTNSDTTEPLTPFDAYRAWLRSLLNAATGLERNRRELDDVLSGSLLKVNEKESSEDSLKLVTNFNHVKDQKEKEIAEKNEKRIEDGANELKFLHRQKTSYQKLRHPYYRDEIAWLYNERGLTSFVQGRLFDALPLLQQASHIMSHRKTPSEDAHAFHAAERRIQLNYAIAMIERGNVLNARGILEELQVAVGNADRSSPHHEVHFARLYIALCDHLGGSLQSAKGAYEECIEEFVKARQLRAVSIANRHLADLLFAQGQYEDAERHVTLAVKAASQAEQRDEQHLALISHARIMLSKGDLDEARKLIDPTLKYSQSMGLYRLTIDAMLAKSLLMQLRGEHGHAGHIASQAVALAVRHGLRLRKIAALLVFAETRIHVGATDLANSILYQVKSEAERLGYQTRAAKAAELLSQLEQS